MEDGGIQLKDGSFTIFLNTKGRNEDEIPEDLLRLLQFIGAQEGETEKDYKDPYISQLQQTIDAIKRDREMGKRYMLLEEFIKRECKLNEAKWKAEGKADSIIYFLTKKSSLSTDLSDHIMKETDLETLDHWLDLAASADSVEQFMESIDFSI